VNEQQKLFFRPLPREHTVEYEEDFGTNIHLHRQYVGPQMEQEAPARLHGLGRSRTEIQDMRRDLAAKVNRARNEGVRKEAEEPQFVTATDDNDPVGTIVSARFLFDEQRMAFVKRFMRHFGENPRLLALGEACAVLYGADRDEGEVARSQEAWYHEFLGLDLQTLHNDAERATEALAQAEEGVRVSPDPHLRLHEGGGEDDDDEGAEAAEHVVKLPGEVADFSALYANFAAYCAGKTRAAVPGVAKHTVAAPHLLQRKATWREMMAAIAQEDFHRIASPEAVAEAEELSTRLGTLRLFDAKLGEIVKEQANVVRAGDLPSAERHMAVNHPDRRSREPDLK
jgi:hypothetical protein